MNSATAPPMDHHPQIKVTKKGTGQNLFVGQQMQSEQSLGVTDVLTPNHEQDEATLRNYSQFKDSQRADTSQHHLNLSINMASASVNVDSQPRLPLCDHSVESPVLPPQMAKSISRPPPLYDSHTQKYPPKVNQSKSRIKPRYAQLQNVRINSLNLRKGTFNNPKFDKKQISSQDRQVRSSLNNQKQFLAS